MATTRTTFAALLGTLTVAANTVSNTLSTVDTTVGMASTAINDAARRQAARSKIDEISYKEHIAKEKAMELEMQHESIMDWCEQEAGRAERFNATYTKLIEALA